MKSLIKLILSFVVVALFVSCERVAPNYAGVLMENYERTVKKTLALYLVRLT